VSLVCERCQQQPATVHVTDVAEVSTESGTDQTVREVHLCEACSQAMALPSIGPPAKVVADNIWKLLTLTKQARRPRSNLACPDCKMTLEELQRRGRLGCPRDYEVFKQYLGELLERMHGARQHVGRVPGLAEGELERIQRISDLRQELDVAVREEQYERAASIRDELRGLELEADT
jgi:protein arginine kinase activator